MEVAGIFILQSFDALFDVMDNADKKLLIKELIEKIDLYPRKNRSGQWIKTIYFTFPMYYNDSSEADCTVNFDADGNFLPKGKTDSTMNCRRHELPCGARRWHISISNANEMSIYRISSKARNISIARQASKYRVA